MFKSQMKEDVEMNDKTEIKTDKISYRKYYRQMGILGTLGGAMWIFYWVMGKRFIWMRMPMGGSCSWLVNKYR